MKRENSDKEDILKTGRTKWAIYYQIQNVNSKYEFWITLDYKLFSLRTTRDVVKWKYERIEGLKCKGGKTKMEKFRKEEIEYVCLEV